MYDYVIIGSGIVGSFIARELSQYQVKLLLVEKENDFANYQTLANSGIIHSGYDPKPHTLKAKLCVEGNQLYRAYEKELNIPLLKTGAFVVAHDAEEEERLDALYEQSLINGVPDIHFLNQDQLLKLEPNLSKSITKALSLPTTMVTFPWEVAFHALEHAYQNGVVIERNAKVTNITYRDDTFFVEINQNRIVEAKAVINAAGVYCEEIARMVEPQVAYQIRPKRGEYFVLDKRVKGWIQHVIYPLPTHLGKGILIVPQVHGNILLGPTSIPQRNKETLATTSGGLMLIKAGVKALVDDVPYHQVIRQFAGVRAASTYEDFYIQQSQYVARFYHVAGIDSPGLTAAPAIAKYLIEQVIQDPLIKKETHHPYQSQYQPFFEQDETKQKQLFQNDARHGNIICKCEHITEGDVIAAMKGPLGSNTIKGIKKRTRAGSGLCQGGYCEREVLKLISKETGIPMDKVDYYAKDTPILAQETKVKS